MNEINASQIPISENSPSPKAVAAEAKLMNIGDKIGATRDGISAISNLLDICKDADIDPEGWPDLVSSRHLVQKIEQTVTIAKPVTIPSGGWDCSIYMSPMVTSLPMIQYTPSPSAPNVLDVNAYTTGIVFPASGGLEVRAGVPGSDLTYADLVSSNPMDVKYTNDCNVRVIGMGFEICNTTNELNVQGAITVFRAAGNPLDETLGLHLSNSAVGSFPQGDVNAYSMPQVPENSAQAKIIPGSKTWKAKDGCYCNCTLASDQIKPSDGRALFNVPYYIEFSTGTVWSCHQKTFPGNVLIPDYVGGARKPLFAPFNLSGAFFTGLSDTTVLTVNYTWIIERFPTYANTDLIVLSRRATLFDPTAIELYARIADLLPAGVPFNENDYADWIATIADIAGMAGLPFMNLVRPAINAFKTIGKTTPTKSSNNQFRLQQDNELQNVNRKVKNIERRINNNQPPRQNNRNQNINLGGLPPFPIHLLQQGNLSKNQRKKMNKRLKMAGVPK